MKCAAGVGGEDDRIGGERVFCPFGNSGRSERNSLFLIKLAQGVYSRSDDVLSHPEFCLVRIFFGDGIDKPLVVAPRPGDVREVSDMRMKSEKAVAAIGGRDDFLCIAVSRAPEDQHVLGEVM